jgi:hypothetical protein
MFSSSASMQVKISLRRKFPNDLADCPRCRARNFSPGYRELFLRKTRSYETLPNDVFLKLLEPQIENAVLAKTYEDYNIHDNC